MPYYDQTRPEEIFCTEAEAQPETGAPSCTRHCCRHTEQLLKPAELQGKTSLRARSDLTA